MFKKALRYFLRKKLGSQFLKSAYKVVNSADSPYQSGFYHESSNEFIPASFHMFNFEPPIIGVFSDHRFNQKELCFKILKCDKEWANLNLVKYQEGESISAINNFHLYLVSSIHFKGIKKNQIDQLRYFDMSDAKHSFIAQEMFYAVYSIPRKIHLAYVKHEKLSNIFPVDLYLNHEQYVVQAISNHNFSLSKILSSKEMAFSDTGQLNKEELYGLAKNHSQLLNRSVNTLEVNSSSYEALNSASTFTEYSLVYHLKMKTHTLLFLEEKRGHHLKDVKEEITLYHQHSLA